MQAFPIHSCSMITYRILNDLQFHPEASKSSVQEQAVLVGAVCRYYYWVRRLPPWSNVAEEDNNIMRWAAGRRPLLHSSFSHSRRKQVFR